MKTMLIYKYIAYLPIFICGLAAGNLIVNNGIDRHNPKANEIEYHSLDSVINATMGNLKIVEERVKSAEISVNEMKPKINKAKRALSFVQESKDSQDVIIIGLPDSIQREFQNILNNKIQ